MAKTLPELFAEVCGKVPGFELIDSRYELAFKDGEFVIVDLDLHGGPYEPVADSVAEHIIIGACVAMLPEHSWIPYANRFLVTHLQTQTRYEAPTLAAALLLAVLAQAERSGT